MLSRSTRLVSSPIRTAAVVRPGSGLVAADVKQLVEDEDTGAQSYRYVRTGTDHYSLAVYLRVHRGVTLRAERLPDAVLDRLRRGRALAGQHP